MKNLPKRVFSFFCFIVFSLNVLSAKSLTIDENAVDFPSREENKQLYDLNKTYPNLSSIMIDTEADNISDLVLSGQFPALNIIEISGNSRNFSGKLTGIFSALNAIDISSTSGDCRLDLRGKFSQSLKVRIRGTSGNISLRLPHDIGIKMTIGTTSGEVYMDDPDMLGPSFDFGRLAGKKSFENARYKNSKLHLDIRVDVTSGNVFVN